MGNYISLNRFFSKTTFSKILCGEYASFYDALRKQYSTKDAKTNKDIVSSAYSILKKEYRNEYFYKNSLLYELVLSKHKIESTKVFSELNLGKCIADFVTINGKTVVYEIKTEFDVLDRIEQQISQYYECFPLVCVVTSEKHLKKIINKYLNTSVGIYLFNKKNKIEVIQEPTEYCNLINKKTIFGILRKNEYEFILQNSKKELPVTTQVNYYSECFKLFSELDYDVILKNTTSVLKSRFKSINEKFFEVPSELKMLVYQSDYTDDDYKALFDFLKSNPNDLKEEKRNVLSLFAR